MIKYKKIKKVVEETEDIICDICGCSCNTGISFEYAHLLGDWGYGSKKDGTIESRHICEKCYDKKIEPLFTNTNTNLQWHREIPSHDGIILYKLKESDNYLLGTYSTKIASIITDTFYPITSIEKWIYFSDILSVIDS